MFSLKPSLLIAGLGLLSVPGLSLLDRTAPAVDTDAVDYEVTVTNITRGQILSPVIVVSHTGDQTPIFQLGQAASNELAMVAEDAINQPLIDMLNASAEVNDVQVLNGAGGPLMPGETAKIVVQGDPGRFNQLSLVSMLVVTNDAFAGLSGVDLPRRGSVDYRAAAYDAGSEANNEMCAFIPGPPCNNPMIRQTTGAEGYVHVHAGIHGIGDLDESQYDWRGDVAAVSIRRM